MSVSAASRETGERAMSKTLEEPMGKRAVVCLHIPFRSTAQERPGEGRLYADSAVKHRYMQALRREFDAALPLLAEYSVRSIYVRGGSPSVMRPDDVSALMRHVRESLNLERGFELAMQTLPQTVGTPCMDGMKAGGVNCIDLQVASATDAELEGAGCGYVREHVDNAMRFISRFSFPRLGFDAMCGLPGQSERSLRESVKFWTFYEPEHITLTRWNRAAVEAGDASNAQGYADELLGLACEELEKVGYVRYAELADDTCMGTATRPTTCFALPGKERDGVVDMLLGSDVFAFGLGATSLMEGVECTTTDDLGIYLENSESFDRIVARAERLDEAGIRRRLARLGTLCRDATY